MAFIFEDLERTWGENIGLEHQTNKVTDKRASEFICMTSFLGAGGFSVATKKTR